MYREASGKMVVGGGKKNHSEIKKLLRHGMNYAVIGKTIGLSRERVRQLAQESGLDRYRWQVPEGYLSVRKYAESKGLTIGVVLGRVRSGELPALKIHNRLYIHFNEGKRCHRCGKKLDESLQESRRLVCDECKVKARKKAGWRSFYRRKNLPLGPTLEYMRKPSN
jgi:DNA-directed RNA polymerase subunit RPC12/RpoP